MSGLGKRLTYLFTSTKGLMLTAIALVSLIAAIWSTLSGPMVEWGIKDITVNLLGMQLVDAEREGRLIMLYHSIAYVVIAILVYLITATYKMKESWAAFINGIVTVGYLTATISGLGFAYFGHNWTLHGTWLLGLSLIFFAGWLLVVALWPWNKEYYLPKDSQLSHFKSGLDKERIAMWAVAVATLGSAMLAAWSGSYFSKGFNTFLAEDTVRIPEKSALDLAVIGHLHIMLALMGIAITLIVGRWLGFKGVWHKLAMPSMVLGTITLTLGAWAVVPYENIAHWIIYVGATFSMTGGLFMVIWGLPKITKDRLAEQGIEKATFGQTVKALFHDPLKFGVQWQMIYMNFNTSFVGIFMAIKLEDIFRVWPHREERIELSGHWHILSAIIATMILFLFADKVGLKGRARQIFGWSVLIGSDIAFGAMTTFEMKRLGVSEFMQQGLVNTLMLLADIGLAAVLIVLATFLVWRLADLFKKDGIWKTEHEIGGFDVTPTTEAERAAVIAKQKSQGQVVSK